MRETNFNTEVMNSLKKFGAWAYKIADSPTSWTMAATRFTPEKPCDIIACYDGKFLAIEGKQIKKFKAFGMSDMRPAQIKNLTEVIERGGRAFIFLNVRIPAIKGKQKRENRLLIFDWAMWKDRLERESIKKGELEISPYYSTIKIGDDRYYDLRVFIKKLRE
jgi:hypothetical protein